MIFIIFNLSGKLKISYQYTVQTYRLFTLWHTGVFNFIFQKRIKMAIIAINTVVIG